MTLLPKPAFVYSLRQSLAVKQLLAPEALLLDYIKTIMA